MRINERRLVSDDIDEAKKVFDALKDSQFRDFLSKPMSETDTRSKVIDLILRDVLGWPETLIKREPHVCETGGYIDYLLSTSHPYFVVEAKRNEHLYHLPLHRTRHQYKVGGVLKEDKNLYEDMFQAKTYATNCGVGFCCLTNGSQFLFYRSHNDSGISWDQHVVVVFRDHDDVADNFSLFFHLLSYASVSQGVVHGYLPITENYDEALRRFRKLNPAKQILIRTRERNKLFPALKTIISRVFQDISGEIASSEILENCYVESPRDSSYEKGLDGLLRKRPLDMGHNAKTVSVSKKDAGEFQKTVTTQLAKPAGDPEVLLILGGVGVGKTTFIHRFREVIAREDIDQSCLWAYVDFNKYSDTGESLLDWVVGQLWIALENDYDSLGINSFASLKQAYHAEYEQLKRGRLAPLFQRSPEEFELAFSEKLGEFERVADQHFVKLIRVAARRTGRRPFLVFDNADQFSSETQDQVFRLAQKFAKDVGCASIISLREESYWKNKDHGTLSAFHAVSYHVQPPRLSQVISKRFKFARKILEESERDFVDSDSKVITAIELESVMDKVAQSLLAQDSRYLELLEYLSPFEIRRPLEFLARFLVSGHTNMDSLLRACRIGKDITIGFHEFFAAVALGDREFYSESASDIVNMFAVDGRSDASNLNRLVVVGRVLKEKHAANPFGEGFVPVSDLVNDCEEMGVLPDTVRSILALFNAKRIVETETQDKESLSTATFVRATAAAQYYMDKLIYDFAYLDTVIIDTAIGDSEHYDKLKEMTDKLSDLQARKATIRIERLEVRLERVKRFLKYIDGEFENSTIKDNLDRLDPSVQKFFKTIEGKFLRQSHEIIKRAREIFLQ